MSPKFYAAYWNKLDIGLFGYLEEKPFEPWGGKNCELEVKDHFFVNSFVVTIDLVTKMWKQSALQVGLLSYNYESMKTFKLPFNCFHKYIFFIHISPMANFISQLPQYFIPGTEIWKTVTKLRHTTDAPSGTSFASLSIIMSVFIYWSMSR